MRGIVIAGGLGTRLRPLTLTRPKPLMPLVNAPLLEYQLTYLRAAGIREVCFATNYMAEAVEEVFGDGSSLGLQIIYAREHEPLDTGGAIRNAYDSLPGEDCVVLNGDTIHAFDIAAIIERHRARKAEVTLTLKEVARPHAYGVVPLGPDGSITGFIEPSDEAKRSLRPCSSPWGGEPVTEASVQDYRESSPRSAEKDTINAGLYVISRRAIESIPRQKCNVEREVFPRLIREGWRILGDVQDGFWIDIGRPAQYLAAVSAIVQGIVPCARPFRCVGDSAIAETASVAENAEVVGNSSIGPDAQVEDGARIEAAVLLEGSSVGRGAIVRRSIVGEGAVVGPFCVIEDTVVAPYACLEECTNQAGLV